MAQAQNKTQPTDADVTGFLSSVEHETRRQDGLRSTPCSAASPVGSPHVGADDGRLRAVSLPLCHGREGDFLATGFSPRKANLSIYIMPGYQDYGAILKRLGKHKTGKSCLYINKLAMWISTCWRT
jgi:hypothetical protein